MAVVFWGNLDILLIHYLPKNQTINSAYYCCILRDLRNATRRKREDKFANKQKSNPSFGVKIRRNLFPIFFQRIFGIFWINFNQILSKFRRSFLKIFKKFWENFQKIYILKDRPGFLKFLPVLFRYKVLNEKFRFSEAYFCIPLSRLRKIA